MKILVVNAGSSSMKFQLIDVESHEVLAKGLCEKIGLGEGIFSYGIDEKVTSNPVMNDHSEALKLVLDSLVNGKGAPIKSLDEIGAVGHRIVHGGKYYGQSAIIDDELIARVEELKSLAPLHNGAGLIGIEACKKLMPGKPMVAVFDTSFFNTLPASAYMYPIPYEYYEKYAVRKYGFHGTSHRYVAQRTAEFLGEDIKNLNIVTCHIGNGASCSAVKGGVAIDTSMGLTPLDGLMMGTRCGAIDPSIVTFLEEKEGLTPQEMDTVLNKKSGFLGISGVSSDLRDVAKAADEGNDRAKLAYEMASSIIKKYIGMYTFAMGGVDVITCTAGVGENDVRMRKMVFEGLEGLGIKLDPEKNNTFGGDRVISADDSKVKILVIPTDEEFMIAKDTYDLVK
ncbi:acetate/propionate family kinase [Phoenicibacter congonensis]|uniref:acetate/propionate family kinase n=1 Tax=Phoenicibacter congonensis TaxID=1944646 RepID=UPI0009A64BE7|nr:acetate kinase [Phoenicibacter congonensis]